MSLFDTQQPFILFNNKDNSACLDTAAGAGTDVDGQADYSELNDLFANFPRGWNEITPPSGVNVNDWAAGGGGQDLLHGEGGDDVLYGGTGFNLTNTPYSAAGQEDYDLGLLGVIHSIATYDFAADTLYGDQGNDALFGQAGFDLLDGGSGDDLLYGGTQGDTMYGGEFDGCEDPQFINTTFELPDFHRIGYTVEASGEDVMHGERGCDLMYGGNEYQFFAFNDRNFAGDLMTGNRGYDTMFGGDGSDTMRGGKLDDEMYGEGDTDLMYGGMDCDYMEGGDEFATWSNIACAWDGFGDTMYGDNGNGPEGGGDDTMLGGFGDDLMYGETGDDSMQGNGDDDRMFGGDGDDTMEGNDGCDTMEGNDGNDDMEGNAGADLMFGNDGRDDMLGGDGNDTMEGNAGNDTMEGNAGDDDMYGNDGFDFMEGNAGEDLMCGNAQGDRMDGGDDSDRMGGGTGNDVMFGGDEAGINEFWRGEFLGRGNEAGDTMNGGEGDDYVDGQDGSDLLFGGTGVDTLIGGDGNDTINSGEGGTAFDFEVVDVGDGDDTFVYEFAFASGSPEDGNTAVGTDGYVYVQGFDNDGEGDTLVLCNIGEEISSDGCDGQFGCGDDESYNLIGNLITPNAEGQHAVVVKDDGTDTYIFFDDTTTPEDPSDPQILKNEAIILEDVTGVGTQYGQFQDLFSLQNAGYNVVVQNGACPDFIVCEDEMMPPPDETSFI